MRKGYILIAILSTLICNDAAAKRVGGGDIWSFLGVGIGAKPMAFGGAYVAVADDATSPYWNPAGLGQVKSSELTLMRTSANSETDLGRHQYISASIPTVLGSFGASLIHFSIDEIPHTAADNFGEMVRLGDFQNTERAFTASYGRALGKVFRLGANLRRMNQSFLSYSAVGWGWDLGFIISVRQLWSAKNLRLGYIFKNNLNRKWEGNEVDSGYEEAGEIEYRWGLGLDPIVTEKLSSTLAFAYTQINDAPSFISVGGEIRLAKELISLRGGINNWYAFERRDSPFSKDQLNYARQLTAGIGARYGALQVDYAALFERFGLKHIVSLTLRR